MSNFQPLEVVGRGSETQLQVGENSNSVQWRIQGGGVFRKFNLPPPPQKKSSPHLGISL